MLSKLGKYKVIGELGSGAMGVVYRAEDPRLGRLVALKTTNAEVAGNPDLLQRFYREAQAAAKLTHPNIVTIYEIDEANGVPFIAMEYLEGESLQKIIAERRDVSILKKVQIVIDTCKALEYAHQHGIVHRDVKPANIVVLTNGQVKIVDFGIARVGASSMTRTGVVMGTVMYMSPEQVQGLTVDGRSDVFSLGIVLYELLTYELPFPGDDVPSILIKIINEHPPPITKFIPQCPAPLEQVVQRALTKDREKRYQSAEDMAFDLQRIADSLKRETIDVFLHQGQRSLQHGEFTIAKESLQKVLEIDSSHQLAKELLAQVRDNIQSRQREQKVEHSLGLAKQALQAEQYEDVVSWAEEVLRLDPGNEEAKQHKQLAVEKRDSAAKIRRHLERAEKLAAEADLAGAKVELQSLLKIEPENTAALGMMDWVSKDLAARERLRQVAEYLESARAYLAKKNFDKALEALDRARDPGVVNVELDALTQQVRASREKEEKRKLLTQRVAEIEESLSKGKLELAQKAADEALREFEDDPQILKLHAQIVRRMEANKKRSYVDEQLQTAGEFMQKNQFSSALAVLERAIQEVPDDPRLSSYLKSVQESHEQSEREGLRREVIHQANEQVHAKKFDAAIAILEKSLSQLGQSPELVDLLHFVRERQAEQQREERTRRVLSRAQTYLREHQYDEAVHVLESGQQESKSGEIEALLADARHQREEFVTRRKEIISGALTFLQSGEAAKAVALFEPAPKAYFKDEEFQRVYSQCWQRLDRVHLVQSTVDQAEKALAEEDLGSAQSVLEQALKQYPSETALQALQKRLKEEEVRLRREQRKKILEEARVAFGRMEYAGTIKLLNSVSWESADLSELAAQAKSLLDEADRRESERQVLSRAQGYLREEQYADAEKFLLETRNKLKTTEIDALLATVRKQREAFERRREEIIASALQMLQSGEAAKAVTLFDGAPKAYFKHENFQRVYSQCRQNVDRANFVRTAADQIKKCLAEEDISAAESLLEQALKPYPSEPTFLALQKHVREEASRLQREERAKVLEEAKVAVGRMEYAQAVELLTSVTWESPDSPELAAQAKSLLEEAQRRAREQGVPQLVRVPTKGREARGVSKRGPVTEPASARKPLIALAAILGVAAIVLTGVWMWYARGRSTSGYIRLTAAPWGEVADVSNAKGEHLNIRGETPLLVTLPPGRYVIELKNGQSNCKVEASVERGSVSKYRCVFPEVKVDDLVQKLLSAY